MEIISITKENLHKEHICCALDSKTSSPGLQAKKEWMNSRLTEGLTFKKLNARGKVFIEYIPAENAWVPIKADGFIIINCLWVSGSYKGKGYAKQLLEECENNARNTGRKGIAVITGNKKKPYLSDKAFFLKHGFEICDTAPPYFEILAKRFDMDTALPQFKETAKSGTIGIANGIDIYYTAQCPFCVPYITMIQPLLSQTDIPVRIHRINDKVTAQNHCCPITSYSVFVDGKFHTHEILTPAKLEKLLSRF